MDYFLAICQALGIGLAVGALLGAFGPGGRQMTLIALVAAALGAASGAYSMSQDDESVVGGIVAGAIGGWLAAKVVSAVVSGALRRTQGGASGLVSLVVLAALVLIGLAILLPPASLVVLVGLAWLALARRSRADRKYEGLRILR
jgi:phosphotransferase system  glucose/maltose/N-acetylglucosamine-specific IIC component